MADTQDPDQLSLGTRLAIGAIAGFVATMALTSTMKRLQKQLPGRDDAPPASAAAPELRLAVSFAYGAACGAALAAVSPRPGRIAGALAGGGLWFAAQAGLLPAFAALPKGESGLRRDLTAFGGHLAWGWSAAATMRELGGVRDLLAGAEDQA